MKGVEGPAVCLAATHTHTGTARSSAVEPGTGEELVEVARGLLGEVFGRGR